MKRLTIIAPLRSAILRQLEQHGAATAKDIHQRIAAKMPEATIAGVYKALIVLSSQGAITTDAAGHESTDRLHQRLISGRRGGPPIPPVRYDITDLGTKLAALEASRERLLRVAHGLMDGGRTQAALDGYHRTAVETLLVSMIPAQQQRSVRHRRELVTA